MGKNITGGFIRDTAIGLVVAVLGAVLVKYADIPTRISVVESKQEDIKSTVQNIDNKIDILIQRIK